MSLSTRERKCPDCGNSMCKVMVVQNVYRCVRKEKVENVYDLGRMVRGAGESVDTDEEDLKCFLAAGSRQSTGKVIRSLSPLALIWKLSDLDSGLLDREPNCNFPGRRC